MLLFGLCFKENEKIDFEFQDDETVIITKVNNKFRKLAIKNKFFMRFYRKEIETITIKELNEFVYSYVASMKRDHDKQFEAIFHNEWDFYKRDKWEMNKKIDEKMRKLNETTKLQSESAFVDEI